MKKRLALCAALAAALLAACGGGGDDYGANFYAGTYRSACVNYGATSAQITRMIDQSADRIRITTFANGFPNGQCVGTPVNRTSETVMVLDFTGVKPAYAAQSVVEVDRFAGAQGIRDIFYTDGHMLYTGAPSAPRDAEGYPNRLETSDPTMVFWRQ